MESSALHLRCPRCVISQRSSFGRHASKQASAGNSVSICSLLSARSDPRKRVHPHSVGVLTRLHAKRQAIDSAAASSHELCPAPASMTLACRCRLKEYVEGLRRVRPAGRLIRARLSKCILLHEPSFLARICRAVSAVKCGHADQPLVHSR